MINDICVVSGGFTISTRIRQIDKNGRLNIPKKYLENLGMDHGEDIFIYCLQDRMVISKNYFPEYSGNILGSKAGKKKISGSKAQKYRSSDLVTDEFNPEWAYDQRERGLSLQGIADLYEKGTGREVDRTVFSRWIKKHEELI